MIYSLTIGDKNTWKDWHLMPTSRPTFSLPDVQTNYVDVNGRDGSIDLTSALTGYPSYKNREGSFEFVVMHTGISTNLGDTYGYENATKAQWIATYSELANYLHGKEYKIIYDDDPSWYYHGRLSLNEWKSDDQYSTIALNYSVEPFKYKVTDTSEEWWWDTFNFTNDVIRTYNTDKIQFTTAGNDFTITGTIVPVVPTVYVTANCTLTTPDITIPLSTGNNYDPRIMVYPGKQTWRFSGSDAKASIKFRERSL